MKTTKLVLRASVSILLVSTLDWLLSFDKLMKWIGPNEKPLFRVIVLVLLWFALLATASRVENGRGIVFYGVVGLAFGFVASVVSDVVVTAVYGHGFYSLSLLVKGEVDVAAKIIIAHVIGMQWLLGAIAFGAFAGFDRFAPLLGEERRANR